MSGGPPHHPHGRQAPSANTAWNHLQVPNYFPARQPQHAHMSAEHSMLPSWHTPTPTPSDPMKALHQQLQQQQHQLQQQQQHTQQQQQPSSHSFSLEKMLSERQAFARQHQAPGVDLTLTARNGSQNGELTASPISLSVRDTNKINSLPPGALEIQPLDVSPTLKPMLSPGLKSLSPGLGMDAAAVAKSKRSSKRVDSILERLNPTLEKPIMTVTATPLLPPHLEITPLPKPAKLAAPSETDTIGMEKLLAGRSVIVTATAPPASVIAAAMAARATTTTTTKTGLQLDISRVNISSRGATSNPPTPTTSTATAPPTGVSVPVLPNVNVIPTPAASTNDEPPPTMAANVVSPYSNNEDSLDSTKSRRKRKPSKTVRVPKEEEKQLLLFDESIIKKEEEDVLDEMAAMELEVRKITEQRRCSQDDRVPPPSAASSASVPPSSAPAPAATTAAAAVPTTIPEEILGTSHEEEEDHFEVHSAAKIRRKASSDSETIDDIAAMVQEGLKAKAAAAASSSSSAPLASDKVSNEPKVVPLVAATATSTEAAGAKPVISSSAVPAVVPSAASATVVAAAAAAAATPVSVISVIKTKDLLQETLASEISEDLMSEGEEDESEGGGSSAGAAGHGEKMEVGNGGEEDEKIDKKEEEEEQVQVQPRTDPNTQFVEVENKLEEMFAGIEDSSDPLKTDDPLCTDDAASAPVNIVEALLSTSAQDASLTGADSPPLVVPTLTAAAKKTAKKGGGKVPKKEKAASAAAAASARASTPVESSPPPVSTSTPKKGGPKGLKRRGSGSGVAKKVAGQGGGAASVGAATKGTRGGAKVPGGAGAAGAEKSIAEKNASPKKNAGGKVVEGVAKENVVYSYDSGSNASSSKSKGPFIQIKGPRDSPLSVNVVNTPLGDDEHPDRSKLKHKKFHDDSEYRHKVRSKGLHCSTLSNQYDAQTKDASWICAFCKRGPHATELSGPTLNGHIAAPGDLFGPYFITTNSPEFDRRLDDPFDKQFKSRKIVKALDGGGGAADGGASKGPGGKKTKRKHSSGAAAAPDLADNIYMGIIDTGNQRSFEVWAHEDCIVWSDGTYLVGPKIVGLEEAIWSSCNVTCTKCQLKGANICCVKRGCTRVNHVCCARLDDWLFDEDAFKTYCPEHRMLAQARKQLQQQPPSTATLTNQSVRQRQKQLP